jgi:uncharacterized protein (DUF2267 family)
MLTSEALKLRAVQNQGGEAMKTGPNYRYTTTLKRPKRKTSHAVFDTTIQKTHTWLNFLMNELDWQNHPHKAYLALRTVLHALRDRLTVEEAIQLGAQLPMLIRGFYYEGWTLTGKPIKERHEEEFLDHVQKAFKNEGMINARSATRAVFKLLDRQISKGEIEDIKHILPKPLQKLWP